MNVAVARLQSCSLHARRRLIRFVRTRASHRPAPRIHHRPTGPVPAQDRPRTAQDPVLARDRSEPAQYQPSTGHRPGPAQDRPRTSSGPAQNCPGPSTGLGPLRTGPEPALDRSRTCPELPRTRYCGPGHLRTGPEPAQDRPRSGLEPPRTRYRPRTAQDRMEQPSAGSGLA